MKSTEEYILGVLSVMSKLRSLNFKVCGWNTSVWQMKAIEQYFHVVLFIMLYKVVLTFKSLDETLVCDHSNESYWAVLSCGTVYYAVQGGSNF